MSTNSPITTHVLDTSSGEPARNVEVTLERQSEGSAWQVLATASTNADGRVLSWSEAFELSGTALASGVYRLSFDVRAYFKAHGVAAFFPEVQVTFEVAGAARHYHVPLLLSPYGYSTYRGS